MSDEETGLRPTLDRYVTECVHLRMGAQLPRPDAATGELLDALLDVRRRMDRVEELLATTLQLRGMAARKHTVFRIQVDDAWDEVAVRQRRHAARDEFSSAKERAAVANLEVLDQRRLERTADVDARLCDEAVETIRLRMRGLSDVRQDILAVVKIRQFESSLER
jgi:hypothetical protein